MMERLAIEVRGIIQGVEFRPFESNLAQRNHLTGFVRNQADLVVIEAEGQADSIASFADELKNRPPPLAQIDRISWQWQTPRGDEIFQIEESKFDSTG